MKAAGNPTGRIVAAILGTVIVLGGPLAPAAAEEIVEQGWWWRPDPADPATESPVGDPIGLPTNPIELPPPPVEEGQLVVQGTSSGPRAISAIRWHVTGNITSAIVTLDVADGSILPPGASILACRPLTPWAPTDPSPGPWDQRPFLDCEDAVEVTMADDGATVTLDVTSFLDGTSIDLVLTPGTVEGVPAELNGSTFTLVIDAPSAAHLVTVPAPPTDAPTPTTSSNPDPSHVPGAPETPDETHRLSPLAPLPVQPPEAVAPIRPPALPPQVEDSPPPDPSNRTVASPLEPVNAPSEARALSQVLILLALMTVAWALLSDESNREFVGVGRRRTRIAGLRTAPAGAPGQQPRGIGRFTQPRTGSPPRI